MRVLIVEDHEDAAAALVAVVEARGASARVATNVAEALKAIGEETFDYALVDQELPARAGAIALVSGGQRVMEALAEAGTPIVVVTGYSKDYPFVAKMFRGGAREFVPKPVREHLEELEEAIGRVEEGGRERGKGAGREREAGAGAASVAVSDSASGGIELVLDGGLLPGRTTFLVNGVRRSLPDAKFVVVLRFGVAHERAAGTWSSRAALGIVQRDMTARIREGFKGALPKGFELVEADRRGNFRLNPAVVMKIDWGKLEGHPDPAVQKIVAEWKKRKGR